jgi:hypothetical protein
MYYFLVYLPGCMHEVVCLIGRREDETELGVQMSMSTRGLQKQHIINRLNIKDCCVKLVLFPEHSVLPD